jgi:hypothetical protein
MFPMFMDEVADQILATDKNFLEVSIIMPCPNEADTLAACIGKARRALMNKNSRKNQRMES